MMPLPQLTPELLDLLKAEGSKDLWYKGHLRHILKPNGQRQAYDFLTAWKVQNRDKAGPLVLNCHRAFGKSFFLLTLCCERALRKAGQEIRFAAPTFKQGLEIVQPIIADLLRTCPKELMPEQRATRMIFKNPRWGQPDAQSTVHFVGCHEDAQAQRGFRSDLVVLDECRDMDNFQYVVNDVFGPHFMTREDPLMVLSSTPPDTIDHPFIKKYIDEGMADNRYFCMPGSKNADLSERDYRMLLDLYGDTEGAAWQREVECSIIPDPSKLIIPEFQKVKKTVVVDEYQRPEWYFPHACVDFGFMDYSAVLYGYNDFEKQTLVIEDEIFVNYKTTGDLARLMGQKEAEVFKSPPWPITRLGDNDQQQLADLREDWKLGIRAVDKHDKESACARLRTRFQRQAIRIHRRCKNLIYQLEVGTRKENGDFDRTETCGHCDAIAALIYLNRMLNFQLNPFPLKEIGGPNMHVRKKPKPVIDRGSNVIITRQPLVATNRRAVS